MGDQYDPSKDRLPPNISFWERHDIPHYYGDSVRALFIIVAALGIIAIPLSGPVLLPQVLLQVGCVLVLILLAGLTNPHSPIIMWINAVVAALGILLVESVAISFYTTDTLALFGVREATVVVLLFAFYYSVKTIRATMLGRLGKLERPWEFEDGGESRDSGARER